jgi:site-specific DNA recombinase
MARVMTLLSRPRVRAVLASPEPKLDIAQLFRERKWLLVSLAPGAISEAGAALVGAALMYSIWSAIEARVLVAPEKRHPIFLYVDELATVTNGLPFGFELLAERARGLGAGLTVAFQTIGRIGEPTRSALLGNVATFIAFREKVRVGVERKFLDGGAHGPARTGYLNARENVAGREVAVIAPDPERARHIKLGFDLAATGDHTITTITDVLEDAGLRTRPTPTRPSRPLSRSMIHRILRDDFYTGIVTRKGVKRPGRHEAIIDRETFERVQEVLDGHRASGDRSHKHSHYLKGSIYCACGKRLGYGRHRGRHGGVYDYFSCLSRVQRSGRCPAPYFRVEPVERAIEARYKTLTLTASQQEAIREALHDYVDARAEVARRESSRHARRLRELTGEQQKLVQLYYKGKVSEEVLEAEQTRIEAERTEARRWSAAAVREVTDVMQALRDALSLIDHGRLPYLTANSTERRLINQAVFHRLILTSADNAEAEPTPLYAELARLAHALAPLAGNARQREEKPVKTGLNKTRRSPQDDHDPIPWGRGSYIEQMAGCTGRLSKHAPAWERIREMHAKRFGA